MLTPLRPALRWFGDFSGALASVFFPAGCRLCDQLLTNARRLPLCDECLSSFQVVPSGSCDLCELPGIFDPEFPKEMSLCGDCQRHRFGFQLARSYGLYEGTLARAVLLLKHERIEPLGAWFAAGLAEVVQTNAERLAADVIVPVPLHRQRARERGFNQVELFGRPLAKLLRLPYRPVLLVRSRARPEKHLLRNDEPWDAVRGAFAIQRGRRVDNLRILLLDDVMTTGATLDACSRALREAGAQSVLCRTIARAVRPAELLRRRLVVGRPRDERKTTRGVRPPGAILPRSGWIPCAQRFGDCWPPHLSSFSPSCFLDARAGAGAQRDVRAN
jgi:ComF family protein